MGRPWQVDKQSQFDASLASRGDCDGDREGGGVKRERGRDGGVSRRADVPDSVNVLDGVADLLAELFLIKLHLQQRQQKVESNQPSFPLNGKNL